MTPSEGEATQSAPSSPPAPADPTQAPAQGASTQPVPQEELDLRTGPPVPLKELDLTGDPPSSEPKKPSTVPYNLDRHRENTRGMIALILVGLLAVVLLLAMGGLIWGNMEMKDLKELLTIILGPLVALVGAATGFYFGGGGKLGDGK